MNKNTHSHSPTDLLIQLSPETRKDIRTLRLAMEGNGVFGSMEERDATIGMLTALI